MRNKQLIIIPGSCSTKSNWLDQILHFTAHGYDVKFLDLDAHKYRTLVECASSLFTKLKYAIQQTPENVEFDVEELFEDLDAAPDRVILAHSMGAMLLLKILSEPKLFAGQDAETYRAIQNSRIFFLQVPLHVNKTILAIMNVVKYLTYPFFFVYNWLFFRPFDFILVNLKHGIQHLLEPLRSILGLPLNILLMTNSFLGATLGELFNLVNYYKHWSEFSLEGFFAAKNQAMFDQAMMQSASNTIHRFDIRAAKHYHFTVGHPDIFCDNDLAIKFASELGANVLELNMGFHNPQHMFWTQEILHREIKQ